MVEEHGHEEGHENETETDHHDDEDKFTPGSPLNLTCGSSFEFMEMLLLRLNLTSDCCLVNGTECAAPASSGSQRPSASQGEQTLAGVGWILLHIL